MAEKSVILGGTIFEGDCNAELVRPESELGNAATIDSKRRSWANCRLEVVDLGGITIRIYSDVSAEPGCISGDVEGDRNWGNIVDG